MYQDPHLQKAIEQWATQRITRAITDLLEANPEASDADLLAAATEHCTVTPIELGKKQVLPSKWKRTMTVPEGDIQSMLQGRRPGDQYVKSYDQYRIEIVSGALWVAEGANGGPLLDPMFVFSKDGWIIVRAADDTHRTKLIGDIEKHVDLANTIIHTWNSTESQKRIQREISRQRVERTQEEERRAQLEADGFAPAPSVPPRTRPVPLPDTKYPTPAPPRGSGDDQSPYGLTEEQFGHIMDAVAAHRENVERHPGAGAAPNAGEEAHRDALLAALRMRFTDGTGESFSRLGKTDIRLVVSEQVYFYAEAKMWSGPRCVDEAVEQLVEKYLIYRDQFGALVFFIARRAKPAEISPKIIARLLSAHGAELGDRVCGFPTVTIEGNGGQSVRLAVVSIVVDSTDS